MPATTPMSPSYPGSAYVPEIPPLVEASPSELADTVERYTLDRNALARRYPVGQSAVRRQKVGEFHDAWLSRLTQVDFDKLSQHGKVDYILLRNRLTYELRLQDRLATQFTDTAALLPFATLIVDLHESRRRMESLDARAAAATLDRLVDAVETARSSAEKRGTADNTRVVALRAAEDAAALRQTLQQWFRFYDGYDPLFSWWAAQPFTRADKALEDYVTFLRERFVGVKGGEQEPIVGNPIGRAALLQDLEYEMIPYSPEELVAIAQREYAWCVAEAEKASREMGFGEDWRAALEKVKNIHVDPGRQVDLIRDLAHEAIEFVEKHDLVTVPPLARDVWRIEMMPPERQRVNPFFLGGETIMVSYPTATMEHDEKLMSMRGNAIHFSRATVQHELIPGHHLQGFMADRYSTHRRAFGTPFWGEGWALYWEMLLWDTGFTKSAEDRIGMLFWRMHRTARIIFSLSFHLGKMTPQEAIDFLVQKVGHERFTAEGEVRRSFNGTYSPLYQVAYMIGGLQFRALHRELVGSRTMTDRAFHDAILKLGRIPVEMVRASLVAETLTRDYKPHWKFYGPS
jgi:uncharacterized protein (DUF885 family)